MGGPITVLIENVLNFKSGNQKLLNVSVCLEKKEYEIEFLTGYVNTISYHIKHKDSMLKSEEFITFRRNYKVKVNLDFVPPQFQMDSRKLYLNFQYHLHPLMIDGGGCKLFSLEDESILPDSMTFNPIYGSISGKLKSEFLKTVEINCINSGTKYPIIANYFVEDCPPYSTPYEIKIESSDDGENIVVEFESQNVVIYSIRGVQNYREYSLSGCLQTASFKLRMYSVNKKFWGSNTSVVFTFNNKAEQYKHIFSSLITEENFTSVVHDPKWSFSNSQGSEWNNDFDSIDDWEKIELSKLPQVDSVTRYYRLAYDLITDYDLLDSLLITTTFNGGMVLYVNGKEIMRKDLELPSDPETELTKDDLKSNYEIEVPGNLLRQGMNYIAVEIHRELYNLQVDDSFRVNITVLISDLKCTAKTLFSFMNPSMKVVHNLGENPIPNTIDLDYDTELIESIEGQTFSKEITYIFPQNKRKSFNEQSIVTTRSCPNRDIMSWELLGDYFGNNSFMKIDEILDSKINGDPNDASRSKLYNYMIPNSLKTYESYKLHMKSVRSTSGNDTCKDSLGFAEFYVSSCKEVMCESKDGFPSARINTKSHKSCENGKIGRIERFCKLNGDMATWEPEEENCEEIVTSFIYQPRDLVFEIGKIGEFEPSIEGEQKGFFSVVGSLPQDITINEKTGKISNKTDEVVDWSFVYVLYKFKRGANLISQRLTIRTTSPDQCEGIILIFMAEFPQEGSGVVVDFRNKGSFQPIVTLRKNSSENPFNKTLCITQGVYILSLTSKWKENQFVSITYQGEEEKYRNTDEKEKKIELFYFSFVNPTSLIQRSDVYLKNWLKQAEIDWPKYPNNFPERKTVTTYYRFEFNFSHISDPFSYIRCKLLSEGAVVLFLNGFLLYRRGLEKDFFRTDFSKKIYSSEETKEIRLNINALLPGKNILGIEIHKYVTSTNVDPFKLIELTLISDESQCSVTNTYDPTMLIYSNRGYEYERSNDTFTSFDHVVNNLNKDPFNTAKADNDWLGGYNLLDINEWWYDYPTSNLGQPTEKYPLIITMGYPNNIAKPFTQYYFIVNLENQPQFAPWKWTFYGSYDNTTEDWDLLQNITEAGFTEEPKSNKTFQLLNQYQSYEYFKLNITGKRKPLDGTNQLFMYRFHVQYCKPRYCNENGGFPKSNAGFTSSIPCSGDMEGSQDRNCYLNEKGNPNWDSTIENCRIPKQLVYSSELLFFKGIPNTIPPIYSSTISPLQFTTNCTFPEGIYLNPENGVISGTSNDDLWGKIFIKRMKCQIVIAVNMGSISNTFEFTYKSMN